jgi:aldehyde:ferredoxin oxidoreductase
LKYAGWDGIVIEGAADDPVGLASSTIGNIESAKGIWGLDIYETQEEI